MDDGRRHLHSHHRPAPPRQLDLAVAAPAARRTLFRIDYHRPDSA
eukprot:COSAG01_NODE_21098_length_918_cov_1.557998_1_plen_44_part_10